MAKEAAQTEAYDIFLSYRRDGGETMAILLRDRLTARGYRVFLDVESLNSGDFNKKLLDVIEACTDFIVVLSKDSLDRCVNEGDWVRVEIAHALEKGKNIVPVLLRGFEWPAALPGDIAELSSKNGVTAGGNEYFDAAIERLADKFLLSRPAKKAKKGALKWLMPAAALLVAAIVALVIWSPWSKPAGDGAPEAMDSAAVTEDTPAVAMSSDLPPITAESFSNLPVSGNTPANILNGGLAVSDGENIYFAADDFCIYKFNPQDIAKEKLVTETKKTENLNFYKGVLYYTADTYIKAFNPADGSVKSYDVSADAVFVENDAIYYTSSTDSLKLYRLSLDGRESTKMNDLTGISYRVVSDGFLYFSDRDEDSKLYRVKLDGSDKVALSTGESSWTNVIGGDVLYTVMGENSKLVHVSRDAGKAETVAQLTMSCLNTTAEGYFYSSGEDKSALAKLSLDGNTKTKLTDFGVNDINAVPGWVFFRSTEDDALYLAKTDGSALQKAADLGGGVEVTNEEYTVVTAVYTMKVTYTGLWRDGKPQGHGVATVKEDVPGRFGTGDTLEGDWVNGLIEGEGVYTSGSYQLIGVFVNGLKEGTVKQYQNGKYIGDIEFKNGSPA